MWSVIFLRKRKELKIARNDNERNHGTYKRKRFRS